MSHKDIYLKYVQYFPNHLQYLDTWFPNGKNSIRIRETNKQELVFTYNGKIDWGLETVERYFMSNLKHPKKETNNE